ncbi:hypothetical protein V494_04257 [Pseudogymnoascus sp. VKM F-4513 (FW-928)]|nr:hypothetical protein V494_04257 [Pseudogymnoascus sp. VKM F-4513 (FW-928)]
METTAPQAPPVSFRFISIEDFDASFPAPEIDQPYVQNASPLVQSPTAMSSVVMNDKAGSESGEPIPDLGSMNWIGKLQEYHQIHISAGKHEFTETAVAGFPPRFVCSVTIGERPEPFSSTHRFGSKKLAKQHCCKLAIEWLVENGHMPSIDSVSFPKATAVPTAGTAQMSPGAQIAQLCLELRMGPPAYVMNNQPAGSAFWSGYAHFPLNPLIEGRVGEFTNVFGKSNAKGDCAIEVLSFLKDIKKDRESRATTDGVKGCRESTAIEDKGPEEVTAIKA